MYAKLYSYYTRDGAPVDRPRPLLARHLRAKYFYANVSHDGRAGTLSGLPVVSVWRSYLKADSKDPYNDDGRPATLLTQLLIAHIDYMGADSLSVAGLERPNLVWAGRPRQAYDGRPPLKLPKTRVWVPAAWGAFAEIPHELHRMRFQRLLLVA